MSRSTARRAARRSAGAVNRCRASVARFRTTTPPPDAARATGCTRTPRQTPPRVPASRGSLSRRRVAGMADAGRGPIRAARNRCVTELRRRCGRLGGFRRLLSPMGRQDRGVHVVDLAVAVEVAHRPGGARLLLPMGAQDRRILVVNNAIPDWRRREATVRFALPSGLPRWLHPCH